MAYVKFTDSAPINDDLGSEFPSIAEQNLQALRDGLSIAHFADWNYVPFVGAGSDEAPQAIKWEHVYAEAQNLESSKIDLTYGSSGGSDGHVLTAIPKWKQGAAYSYGTEAMTWDVDANLTSTAWSGTITATDFEDGKPVNTDTALITVDYIRENLMALRDNIIFGAMNGWDYTAAAGTGSAEEPQYIQWEKGSGPERLIATLTWSSGRADTEYWQYRLTSATAYTYIGTKTYTYDSDSNVESAIWSGTPTYVGFDDDKPVDSDTGSTALTDIKNNLQGLRDGILYGGMDFWDYSKTDGTGTAEMPQYYFLKKSTDWIRATNTWGTSGGEEHNIASQLWEYSSDSGSSYDSIGTLSFTFTADGAPSATTWS